MKKFLFQNWPLFILIGIWIFFSHPFIINNLIPFPSTYLVSDFSPWNLYSGYEGPIKNAATPDVITQIFPWKYLVIESWKSGVIPLWNTYNFSGTPLLANYQSAALSPLNAIYIFLPFISAWSIQILLQPLLAGFFTYFYVRSLKLSKESALFASIAFMFCGFITTWMLYGTLAYAILFLPLALMLVEKIFQKCEWFYFLPLALTVPLSFFSGHFQTSIYFFFFVIIYILFKLYTTKSKRSFKYSFLALFLGLVATSPQLFPSIELYLNSVRSELFEKSEVIPWGYLPTFIAPDFFGNPVTRNDWFGHYAEWNFYIGVIPLILAFYSLFRKNALTIFYTVSIVSVVLLTFQTPLLDLLIFLKIPVLSTSAASRLIVIASFSAAILSAYGFEQIRSKLVSRLDPKIFFCIVIFGLIFAALFGVAKLNLFIPGDKGAIAFSNLRLPFLIYIIFSGIVFVFNYIKNVSIKKFLVAIIIFITVFDMLRFATKWMPFETSEYIFKSPSWTTFFEKNKHYERGLGNYSGEASMMLKIPSTEGYDPLYIDKYGEFIASIQDGNFHTPERSVVNFPKNGRYTDNIVNLLGIKYIIHKVADSNASWTFPIWDYPVDRFNIIHEDSNYQIFENNRVYPRAYLLSEYIVVPDEKANLKTTLNEDLKEKIVLFDELKINLSSGSAKIKEYQQQKIKIETSAEGKSILFLSDPYYPGWEVKIDGAQQDLLRANYAFRAVVVPKGEHLVEFEYNPASFKYGLMASGIGIVGIIGFGIYLRRK